MPRILVTGATGFIGRHVLPLLTAEGWEVHTLGRRDPGSSVHHEADVLEDDPSPLLDAIRPTHLLHLAWVTDPDTYQTSPLNRRWAHASVRLLTSFARWGGSHAVCAGTCLEYDVKHGVCTEDVTPVSAEIPYTQWKHWCHMTASKVLEANGTSLSWARLFYLYGPGEDPRRLVANVITSLLRGRKASTSSGAQRRDYLYVADAAAALVALLAPRFHGAVNVGSGSAIEIAKLAELAALAAGDPGLLTRGTYASGRIEPPLIQADIARLTQVSGWEPSTSFEAGLAASVHWWQERLRSGQA